MKQFLLKTEPDKEGLVRLRDEDYHYLVHVRRLKPGGTFTALPAESGSPVTVTVHSIDNHTLVGKIQAAPSSIPVSLPPIYLFQALPKGTKMDLIVRQAAEGGISEVVPFCSERSVPVPGQGKEERWRRIVREARQQSGSAIDTRIHPPLSEDELFAYWEELRTKTGVAGSTGSGASSTALGIIFHESPVPADLTAGPLEQGTFHHYLNREPFLIALALGPEGGFSGAELGRFIDTGFKPLQMGDTVLRTETAALYGAAAVRIILMERAQWMLKTKLNG
jgi:16S rRNA (uracil1498-N3)-methyltransferase